VEEALDAASRAWAWLHAHPLFLLLGAVALAVALLVGALLVWLSSRGKLVFLDNVVRGHAAIREPWRRLGWLADSLFLWRLGFLAAVVVALAAVAVLGLAIAGGAGGLGFGTVRGTAGLLVGGAGLLVVVLAAAFVALLLDGFVVPIMYKANLSASVAWKHFLPWVESYLGSFALYGLFVIALWVGVAVVVVAAGLATCCVGFVLLAIPYVSTAILLPALVTYRAFSLAFIAQMDPAFDLLGQRTTA
jgi:hypothetical protein